MDGQDEILQIQAKLIFETKIWENLKYLSSFWADSGGTVWPQCRPKLSKF